MDSKSYDTVRDIAVALGDFLSDFARQTEEIERLKKIEKAAHYLIANSPIGDDDKPYCSDVCQTEFAALVAAIS